MKFLDHLNDFVKEVKGVVKEKSVDAAKEIKEKVTEKQVAKENSKDVSEAVTEDVITNREENAQEVVSMAILNKGRYNCKVL